MRRAASARIEGLQFAALHAVENAVSAGDQRAALAVLRGVGLLTGRPQIIGLTDPDRLARQNELKGQEERLWDDLAVYVGPK